MLKVIARRGLEAILVLLALVAVVFVLRQVSPVDPARAFVGERASAEVVERARHELGLDRPLPVQYVAYVEKAATGDFGQSAVTRRPVSSDIADFLPATAELVVCGFALAVALGLLLGAATALRWPGSGVLRLVLIGGSSMPVFLAALLGILLFYKEFGILPARGRSSYGDAPNGPSGFLLVDSLLAGRPHVFVDAVEHLVLPVVCLSLVPAVAIGRALRSSLQHTLRSDFIRTARVKGMTEPRVVVEHALRNSANSTMSIAGMQVAAMFGADILLELIFAWPGIGLYTAQAIKAGDYTTIAGITLTLGAIYVLTNFLVDLGQAFADPRILDD
ncbi:ABC transporter permease [Nocardia sp. NPDC050713]|uniref:ABC transporter permease n=1 Tax=Nocardia sp. NPDC050713 TaxID=3154511 RepID=UPI0033FB7BD7